MIKLPIAALVVVIALLGGFYGGYKIGGGGTANAAAASNGGTAGRLANGQGAGGRFNACPNASPSASARPSGSGAAQRGANGTITNLGNTTLTLHDARCNTDLKVTFDASVIVRKTVVGQAADLQDNQTITVVGTRQADGSIKANSIVIGGAGGFGGFGGGAGGAGN